MPSQESSWLSSTADSSNPVSFFTYSNPPTRSATQMMAFNSTRTAFGDSGVQVMHNRPTTAQCRAASQAQRWHDNSTSSVSSFEYSDWAGGGWTGGVPQFDHEHPKTSQLRQDQTGFRIGSQVLPPKPNLNFNDSYRLYQLTRNLNNFNPNERHHLYRCGGKNKRNYHPVSWIHCWIRGNVNRNSLGHHHHISSSSSRRLIKITCICSDNDVRVLFFTSLYFSLPSLLVPTG